VKSIVYLKILLIYSIASLCASPNHHKATKVETSRLIPRRLATNLELSTVGSSVVSLRAFALSRLEVF